MIEENHNFSWVGLRSNGARAYSKLFHNSIGIGYYKPTRSWASPIANLWRAKPFNWTSSNTQQDDDKTNPDETHSIVQPTNSHIPLCSLKFLSNPRVLRWLMTLTPTCSPLVLCNTQFLSCHLKLSLVEMKLNHMRRLLITNLVSPQLATLLLPALKVMLLGLIQNISTLLRNSPLNPSPLKQHCNI